MCIKFNNSKNPCTQAMNMLIKGKKKVTSHVNRMKLKEKIYIFFAFLYWENKKKAEP